MKALLEGRRNASVGIVLGLVGMLCLLAVGMGIAIYSTSNLHKLRVTLDSRCQTRQASDLRQRASLQSDVAFYTKILSLTDQAPPSATVGGRRFVAQYRAAIVQARTDKQTAAQGIVLSSCSAYR